ncbi:MAG: gamma-glutamyltransferase, partial [Gammaproteobacteria bacterium]
MYRFLIGLAFAILIAGCTWQAEVTPRPPHAAIASADPLATQAGMEILNKGGNAFDAAVAVAAALAVVEPASSGLGGGGFFLLHIAAEDRDVFVDAREHAPMAATRDMYLDADGTPIRGASTDGPLAAGIPGEAAGMAWLAEKYGRLPLAESIAPAITYADAGFEMTRRSQLGLRFRKSAYE